MDNEERLTGRDRKITRRPLGEKLKLLRYDLTHLVLGVVAPMGAVYYSLQSLGRAVESPPELAMANSAIAAFDIYCTLAFMKYGRQAKQKADEWMGITPKTKS